MINELLDRIVEGFESLKNNAVYKQYNRINGIFKTPVKIILGFVVIICAVIGYMVSGYSYSHDVIIASLMIFGMFNLVNAMFSAIYRIQISYIPFMLFNAVGFLLYMFVISKYETIGFMYMILFIILIFIAMWICDMCLLYGAGPRRRIAGGLIVNFVMIILTALCVFLVSAVSYIMQTI